MTLFSLIDNPFCLLRDDVRHGIGGQCYSIYVYATRCWETNHVLDRLFISNTVQGRTYLHS